MQPGDCFRRPFGIHPVQDHGNSKGTHVNGYTLITIIVYEIAMLDWSPVDLVRAKQTIRGSAADRNTPTLLLMVVAALDN